MGKAKKAAKKLKAKMKKKLKKAMAAAKGAVDCVYLKNGFSLCKKGHGGHAAKKQAKKKKKAAKKKKEKLVKAHRKELDQKAKSAKRLKEDAQIIKGDKLKFKAIGRLNHARDVAYKTEINALKRLAIPKNND